MGILADLRAAGKAWLGAWNFGPAREDLERERVRTRLSGLAKTLMFLPYADTNITAETATIRKAYRTMLKEPAVKSALLDKVLSVAALDASVNPGDERPRDKQAADFGLHLLNRLAGGDFGLTGLPAFVEAVILPGLIDGYSVTEKIWYVEERGKWAGKVLLRLKNKDPDRQVVLEVDDYNNVTAVVGQGANNGQRFVSGNFVIFRHLSIFDCPTGMSDLRAAYRSYWLMDAAWKLRAIYLEKFSAGPMLKGTYTDPGNQKSQLEDALEAARASTWISIPTGAQVEALDLATRGTADFESAIRDLKEDVYLGISGALLQALQGTVADGRGSSEVHSTTAGVRKWHVRACTESVLNSQVFPDATALNFADAASPQLTLGGIDDVELKESLNIDIGLSRDLRLKLSRKDLYKRYGRPEPLDQGDALAPTELPGLLGAMGAPTVPGEPTSDVQDTALNGAQIASLLEVLDRLAQKQMPPEAVRAVMAAAFPTMPVQRIEQMVTSLARFRPAEQLPAPQPGMQAAEPGVSAEPFRESGAVTGWGYRLGQGD